MDQLASAAATEGHALLIDCSDNSIEHVPVPQDLIVLVVDSGAGRELTDDRVQRSEEGLRRRRSGVGGSISEGGHARTARGR